MSAAASVQLFENLREVNRNERPSIFIYFVGRGLIVSVTFDKMHRADLTAWDWFRSS